MEFNPTAEQVAAWVTLIGAIVGGIVAIVNAIKGNEQKAEARGVAFMEVENRKLAANPETTPVTSAAPPTGTGDGSLDKAVREFVAKASPPPGS